MALSRCQWCGDLRPGSPQRCARCGHVVGDDDAGVGSGEFGLLLIAVPGAGATGFEGRWLEEYDPSRPGRDPVGRPMLAHVLATDDPARALRFASASAARRTWMRWDGQVRPDGKPSRPLTAFTIEISKLPT